MCGRLLVSVALWAVAACLTPAARSLRPRPCSGRLVLKHASFPRVGSGQDSQCRVAAMMNAGSVGKGFGGGEATRDPAPTAYDANDPKCKQQAIHKAESFAQYIASRQAVTAATTEAACPQPVHAVAAAASVAAPVAAYAPSLPYVPRAAPAPVAAPAPSGVRAHDYSCIDNGQPFVAPGMPHRARTPD